MLYSSGETIKRSIVDDVIITLDRMWKDEFENFHKSGFSFYAINFEGESYQADSIVPAVSRADGFSGGAIKIHVRDSEDEDGGVSNFVTKKMELIIQFEPLSNYKGQKKKTFIGMDFPDIKFGENNPNVNADFYFSSIERALMKDRSRGGFALNTTVVSERTSDLVDESSSDPAGAIQAYSSVEITYRHQMYQTASTVLSKTLVT